jgi:hypothetical protein
MNIKKMQLKSFKADLSRITKKSVEEFVEIWVFHDDKFWQFPSNVVWRHPKPRGLTGDPAPVVTPSLTLAIPIHKEHKIQNTAKVWNQESLTPSSNPQNGGPPLFPCTRMLLQYIYSHSLYLQSFTWICETRTLLPVAIANNWTWH